MINILSSINKDTQHILNILDITLEEVRATRGRTSVIRKKVALYCYLRLECDYSLYEIGDYLYKDHSTIHEMVKKNALKYRTYRHKLVNRITQSFD